MKNIKIVLSIAIFCLILLSILTIAQCLLVPHDAAANPEAALVGEFSDGFGTQDVLFLGDCEVYESFSAVTLWREYGIDAWLCGSPQQLMWHSYAMLQKALEEGRPSTVVLGVYGLRYGKPQNEAYNRMALDGLDLDLADLSLLRDAVCEGESLLSYYIPLLRYHDRWQELTWRDVTLLFEPQVPVSYNGYLMQCGVKGAGGAFADHSAARPLTDPAFGEMALDYFDRIVSLCRENEIELILVKAPTDSWAYPWYDEWEAQTVALAERYGLPYYNLLSVWHEIGLDGQRDTYDGGLHLNVHGAEKTAAYFGRILQEHGVPDRRTDAARAAYWESEGERYDAQKKREER